ncbi:SAG family member [Eimeria praecox]|uniref:SAG family member n=1 Tax=Eimeria praecox TaxID=51316 RepID=U6H4B2_9EIME|nr:SAG family member [Eimeria praecox]
MAMYNPSEGATADCRVVTCTKTTNAAQAANDDSPAKPQTESGSALICMTVPDILSKEQTKAPFTDEQWDKIVKTLKGSASAVSPSVVGLAVTVLGLAASLL